MPRICLFPGTFDPITLGHEDIINRAIPLFDKIIVGIGINTSKGPMFTPEQRLHWIN
ncbi:MAG TPA: adenylyltransferase/cytidyltransferase family protein, partial [Niabella sp.]|nr:adenylyltransferase/cytidyltransferase family protein [Niabella sp.]